MKKPWGITHDPFENTYAFNTLEENMDWNYNGSNPLENSCYQTGFWHVVSHGQMKNIAVKDYYIFVAFTRHNHYGNNPLDTYYTVMLKRNFIRATLVCLKRDNFGQDYKELVNFV